MKPNSSITLILYPRGINPGGRILFPLLQRGSGEDGEIKYFRGKPWPSTFTVLPPYDTSPIAEGGVTGGAN